MRQTLPFSLAWLGRMWVGLVFVGLMALMVGCDLDIHPNPQDGRRCEEPACDRDQDDHLMRDSSGNVEDCDDKDPLTYVGADEQCDGLDNDCDGLDDEDLEQTICHKDLDQDGYGGGAEYLVCTCEGDYTADASDCQDGDPSVYPGADDVCNGKDDDCDGDTDNGGAICYYADADEDGYAEDDAAPHSEDRPGYTTAQGDCNDSDSSMYPEASESCDGKDNDCDGVRDEGPVPEDDPQATTFYRDQDGDGYGDKKSDLLACGETLQGYVTNDDDCNDSNASIKPSAAEDYTDTVDNNCDKKLEFTLLALSAGDAFSLALRSDGSVFGWGDNQAYQINESAELKITTPTGIDGLTGIIAVAAGGRFALALDADGGVFSWGSNTNGQLGRGPSSEIEMDGTPVRISGLENVEVIRAGSAFALALTQEGVVYAWGDCSSGQTGSVCSTASEGVGTPMPIKTLPSAGVMDLGAGWRQGLANVSGDAVWGWGQNLYGQVQLNDSPNTPMPPTELFAKEALLLTGGERFSILLEDEGSVFTWGSNQELQLGVTGTPQTQPVQVSLNGSVVSLAAGRAHVVAILENGSCIAWGANESGQLGRETQTPSELPSACGAGTLSNLSLVAAGKKHSLAFDKARQLWGFGEGSSGQLGCEGTSGVEARPCSVPIRLEEAL